ncbi:MAG: DUF4384 domain-containing protein [Leptospira sp.]|nr:DUF4384 domain-containing protein [Leptospira sp.]
MLRFIFLILYSVTHIFSESSIVGVMPFQSADPKLGEEAGAFILGNLASTKKFKFVEKGQLKKALDEIGFTKSGLVKEEEVLEMGKISGASHLILGEIKKEESSAGLIYVLTARIVKTETGIVVGAKKVSAQTLSKAVDDLSNALDELLSIYLLMENPNSPYIIKIRMDKGKNPIYRVKDKVRLTFKVESKNSSLTECYLKIYSIDKSGVISQLFPNKYSSVKLLKVGTEYTFPEDDDDFEWEVTGTPGFEYIQAIAVSKDTEFFSDSKSPSGAVFREVGKDKIKTFRGIQTVIKKNKLGDYSAERVTFQIVD